MLQCDQMSLKIWPKIGVGQLFKTIERDAPLVGPDVAKFRHFGKILEVFGRFSEV